ncbi:NAD(+)/NADH kinase [Natrinema hispanicum]|uniref:Predicted polyphosphate-or ATP-dependent NAD kinase n=1 Tax=Natrinema hispanicum TaxID=392421 RepID=A0A1G6U4Z5_9EURY|nr:NAD(+)/NADH kinase [Natrinema hispanicum]SDD36389.1 Predicted polyphosphate-or ATP-dependent NAD kinase [Natrinema hispanicum]SEU02593.1 Predicted polyphosphate-or ATP-dependent NAD kinase [Natrinema hispanicum]
MATIGLIVNPAAGRDIRRLTGGASVVDNYAKRRVAECVCDGLTITGEPLEVLVMPDRTGIADHAVAEAPAETDATTLEMPIEESSADTRRAAARFREEADAAVVLGGDGTTRDAALELGDVPLVAVSTGTNNVVPSAVDGTVAGAAAALVATGTVPADAVTTRHGTVEARAETSTGERRLTGLAAAEVSSKSFIGTRALLDPSDLRGGVVSQAHPSNIGLPAVAGALEPLSPTDPGGVAVRLTDPDDAPRCVRAIVAPGVTATVGVTSCDRLEPGEPATFDVPDGVVGADGERELELTDATVELTPVPDGPRLVDIDATLERGAQAGGFEIPAVDEPQRE